MDALASSFVDSQTPKIWSYDSLTNFRRISPAVQNHLMRVYLILSCSCLASAIGAYLLMIWNIGLVAILACIVTTIWFSMLTTPQQSSKTVLSVMILNSFLLGASLGPVIRIAINLDQRFLVAFYAGIAIALVCFSVAAKLARRRKYIYLIALLSSAISILMCLQYASVFKVQLYFGILGLVGYMVVETQETIEKAEQGDMDCVTHSLAFFADFAVFLAQLKKPANKEEKKEKEEKKKKKKKKDEEETGAKHQNKVCVHRSKKNPRRC